MRGGGHVPACPFCKLKGYGASNESITTLPTTSRRPCSSPFTAVYFDLQLLPLISDRVGPLCSHFNRHFLPQFLLRQKGVLPNPTPPPALCHTCLHVPPCRITDGLALKPLIVVHYLVDPAVRVCPVLLLVAPHHHHHL